MRIDRWLDRDDIDWLWVCSQTKRIFHSSFFVIILGLSSSAIADLRVRWEVGLLSVTAEKALLSQVLEEVAHKTGLEIRNMRKLRGEITEHFSELSLEKGLKKLLVNVNYILIERDLSESGTQSALVLIVLGGEASTSPLESLNVKREDPENEPITKDSQEMLHAFAQRGDKEALRKALSNPDPGIQGMALELLTALDPQESLALLAQAIKSSHPQVRSCAIDLLRGSDQADESAVMRLLGEAVADKDTAVKSSAIKALAERGGPETLAYLRQTLHDSDPSIRMLTIETIVRTVSPTQALTLLNEAALDTDEEVRSAASAYSDQLRQGDQVN